ncbi:MAG: Rossmann-like domain-containing protein, partial [Candidatus Hodarchaeota archaeon]
LEGLVKKIFSEHAIERSVGYAAINALSQHILHQEKVKLENVDVLDIVGKFPGEPIFMVGKIRPIYNALKKKGRKVLVKDFNKGIQDPGMGESYDGGILIITGSSLSNETLGNELDTFKNVRLAIFIGPSAQVLPGWLFDLTNIDVVASMFFSSPLEAFTAIKQGGGTPNFVRHARKYTFFKNNIIT